MFNNVKSENIKCVEITKRQSDYSNKKKNPPLVCLGQPVCSFPTVSACFCPGTPLPGRSCNTHTFDGSNSVNVFNIMYLIIIITCTYL